MREGKRREWKRERRDSCILLYYSWDIVPAGGDWGSNPAPAHGNVCTALAVQPLHSWWLFLQLKASLCICARHSCWWQVHDTHRLLSVRHILWLDDSRTHRFAMLDSSIEWRLSMRNVVLVRTASTLLSCAWKLFLRKKNSNKRMSEQGFLPASSSNDFSDWRERTALLGLKIDGISYTVPSFLLLCNAVFSVPWWVQYCLQLGIVGITYSVEHNETRTFILRPNLLIDWYTWTPRYWLHLLLQANASETQGFPEERNCNCHVSSLTCPSLTLIICKNCEFLMVLT